MGQLEIADLLVRATELEYQQELELRAAALKAAQIENGGDGIDNEDDEALEEKDDSDMEWTDF